MNDINDILAGMMSSQPAPKPTKKEAQTSLNLDLTNDTLFQKPPMAAEPVVQTNLNVDKVMPTNNMIQQAVNSAQETSESMLSTEAMVLLEKMIQVTKPAEDLKPESNVVTKITDVSLAKIKGLLNLIIKFTAISGNQENSVKAVFYKLEVEAGKEKELAGSLSGMFKMFVALGVNVADIQTFNDIKVAAESLLNKVVTVNIEKSKADSKYTTLVIAE